METAADNFCSLLSSAAGEMLPGSAGRTAFYFLLEYNGAWEDKAFEKSDIPEEVKQRLSGLAKALSDSKILLIKRSPHARSGVIHFFVVIASELNPCLYRFELRSYADLLGLDLAAVLQGDLKYADNLQQGSLYLVCTNGRRDLCCARFGFPIFEALKDKVGDMVWECSHIGGHRFAPNVFDLPYGILYGRLRPQEVEAFVQQAQSGQLRLENLRGRTVYPAEAQAAEYYLRLQTSELGVDAYRLVKTTEIEAGSWQVRFFSDQIRKEYLLNITAERTESKIFESCTLDKQTSMTRFRHLPD
jgi:hypothetical protein